MLVEPPLQRGGKEGVASRFLEQVWRRRADWPSREAAAAHLRARSPYDAWHPEAFAGFVETGLRVRDGAAGAVELACPREVQASVFEHTDLDEVWRLLADAHCPVWVGRGAGDGETPSAAPREVAGQPPIGFDRVAEGSGHFAPLERPDWVAGIVLEALDHLDGASESPLSRS